MLATRGPHRSWIRIIPAVAAVLLLLVGAAPVAAQGDGPVMGYFDDLIAELQVRSDAMIGTTDKAEKKQKKACDKVLKAFTKTSKGVDKDLKMGAKAAKTLAKAFPEEFAPGAAEGGDALNLKNLLAIALAQYEGDVEALLDAAQQQLNGALTGKCRDKAQKILDDVNEMLAELDDDPDLATLAKILGKAIKKTFKGQAAVLKALGCLPKLPWNVSIAKVTIGGETISMEDNVHDFADDIVTSTMLGNTLQVELESMDPELSITVNFYENGNDDQVGSGTIYYDGGYYQVNWTLSSVDIPIIPSLPKHIWGTFSLYGVGFLGTVGEIEVTGGMFGVYTYPSAG